MATKGKSNQREVQNLIDLTNASEIESYTSETSDSNKFSESGKIFQEAKESYNKVDDKLIEFIGNFVTNQNQAAKQKKQLKNIFFWFTMVIFAVIVMTPIICLFVMLAIGANKYYMVLVSLISSVAEVLTTVIVLPKIVAEYLFNKEEETANIKIVELMQKYSDTIHGYGKYNSSESDSKNE